MPRTRFRIAALALAVPALTLGAAACGDDGDTAGDRPSVVVTHGILGAVVTDLVGDAADVKVLMPSGVDPHDWQPSAKDVEAVQKADLVVANGLHLEEGLDKALDEAADAGVAVVEATDFIDVRRVGEGEEAGHDHEGEDAHAEEEPGHAEGEDDHHAEGAEDPHFWTDPHEMRAVVAGLAPKAAVALGADLDAPAADLETRLDDLDAETRATLHRVPAAKRKLVTGHESLGYLARRYGYELVGAVVPGLTSQAQVSASELAELKEKVQAEGVDVVFTEIGTPRQVADAIASEAGARVVELPSHTLPGDGSYFTFMRENATLIADALAGTG